MVTRIKIKHLLVFLGGCFILSGIIWWYHTQPKRINRKHLNTTCDEYKYITKRIDFDSSSYRLTRKQAEEDLDELEWLLENRYSYLRTKGVNYKAVLDSIRNELGKKINSNNFSLQLKKFIALFGDGHSQVRTSKSLLCSGFLPFQVGKLGDRVVAFTAKQSEFLSDSCPFLASIDDVSIDKWLDAAKLTIANGSPQFTQYGAVRHLIYIQYLRKELGIETAKHLKIELQSFDGKQHKTLEIPIADEILKLSPFDKPSQILKENIGYLRISGSMPDSQEFLDDLVAYMHKFQNTDGLIIDIRENFGGSRAPLCVLYPFFVNKNEPPKVVNIAAYRLGNRKDILEERWLYPANSKNWSSTEKEAIKQLMKTFQPEIQPIKDEFSCWHYFILNHSNDPKYYYYNQPVVILMDSSNYSACDIFLSAFKGMKNITLIGSPSGGGSGRTQSYRLHNSKIEIYLSSMMSFQNNGKLYDGNGIFPDELVEPILTDFIGKTDSILDIAIQKLRIENSGRLPN